MADFPFGALATGLGVAYSAFSDYKNRQHQSLIDDYNMKQNEITRQREDTAIQRRVADLESAGFNKFLALGQNGALSAPVSVGGSEVSNTVSSGMASLGDALNEHERIKMQRQLADNTVKKSNADIEETDARIDLLKAQTADVSSKSALAVEQLKAELALLQHNMEIYFQNEGTSSEQERSGSIYSEEDKNIDSWLLHGHATVSGGMGSSSSSSHIVNDETIHSRGGRFGGLGSNTFINGIVDKFNNAFGTNIGGTVSVGGSKSNTDINAVQNTSLNFSKQFYLTTKQKEYLDNLFKNDTRFQQDLGRAIARYRSSHSPFTESEFIERYKLAYAHSKGIFLNIKN